MSTTAALQSAAWPVSVPVLAPGSVPFANASGVLSQDTNLAYDNTNKVLLFVGPRAIGATGLVRGQGATNTSPGGGIPPINIWSSNTVQDPNDFGHNDKTLMSIQEGGAAYSAAVRGPLVNLTRYHATADTSTLVTTVLNISSYSPASVSANQESSCIFLGLSGRANGLSIYKNNSFRPVGYTDESVFNSKCIEIGDDDAGTAVEVSVGYTNTKAYQTQAHVVSLSGTGVGTAGTKGMVVQPGSGTFDDRPAYEVASFAFNAPNTNQQYQVTLSGKEFIKQTAVVGAGQSSTAFDMAGALGGSILLNDSNSAIGSGGASLFGVKGTFATRTAFAYIKGYATDSSSNTAGDLVFGTRTNSAASTMAERFRLLAAGNLLVANNQPLQFADSLGTARTLVNLDAGNTAAFGPTSATGAVSIYYGNGVEGFRLGTSGGFKHANTSLSFFGAGLQAKQTVSGAKGSNAALASVIAALVTYGLITDSSTA